jgi:uncharacterized membrane protein
MGIWPMLILFVLLLVSLSLMSDATNNSERFGQLYSWLLLINALGLISTGWFHSTGRGRPVRNSPPAWS